MENKFLLELLEKLNSDPEFLNQFLKKETIDEMYEFSTNAVSGYSKEEFIELIEKLKSFDKDNSQQSDSKEIPDESLDKVSGGSIFGVAASGLLGFIQGGGGSLIKKIGNKLTQPEKDKKYKEYLKKKNLTEAQLLEQLAQNQARANQEAYEKQLIEQFKSSL